MQDCVKWKQISELAREPYKATIGSAGYDLTAISMTWLEDDLVKYETGISFELPENYVGLLFSRSSVHKTGLQLTNAVGVLDADYRGTVSFVYRIVGKNVKPYEIGDRIGQIVFLRMPACNLMETTKLTDTERGTGGYGSTGR